MSSTIGHTPYLAEEEQSSIPQRRVGDKVRQSLDDVPIRMAKAMGARALRETFQVTGTALKECGPKSTVHAWLRDDPDGEPPKNPSLAAVIANGKRRRAFAIALLKLDSSVRIETVITIRESA